jgi:hypothetical protein
MKNEYERNVSRREHLLNFAIGEFFRITEVYAKEQAQRQMPHYVLNLRRANLIEVEPTKKQGRK